MEEILLNEDEIKYINNKAQYSLLMHNPGIYIQFTRSYIDIFHITPFKKLIFIKGHEFTGLQHINMRHRFYSTAISKVNGGFMSTSRFAADSGILDDYISLVECLYDEKFLVPGKNKRPDLFDAFQAKIAFKGKSEFRLILYKGTKIVHTLFPIEKKKLLKHKREEIIIELFETDHVRAVIPYTDINGILKFGIGFNFIIPEKKELWSVLIYENDKLVKHRVIGEMKVEYKFGIENRLESVNHIDLTEIENKIIEDMKTGN